MPLRARSRRGRIGYNVRSGMPEPSLAQRQRDLLRRLTSLVAERAKGETDLDERRQRETAAAEKVHRTAVAAAEAEFARRETALNAEHAGEQERVRAEWESRLEAARTRMETHLKNYNGRTAALVRAANRELEETRWLIETMVESGQSKH